MRPTHQLAALAALLASAACSDAEPRGPEGHIDVRIGAKAIQDGGFANACFDVLVITVDGATAGDNAAARESQRSNIYVQRGDPNKFYPDDKETLCTNTLGQVVDDGRQAFSQVFPCIDGATDVVVKVDSLWERNPAYKDGSTEPQYRRVTQFFDPCGEAGCVQHVACEAYNDKPAFFNLQMAKPLDVGFADLMVSIGDLACAAKFDCVYPDPDGGDAKPIKLLPHGGELVDTGVMAVACTSIGESSGLYMNLTDVTVACSDPAASVASVNIQIAANKRQNVFGQQVEPSGKVTGFYAQVAESGEPGIARQLVEKGDTFIGTHVASKYQSQPAVIGYITDGATGTTRRLGVAVFRQGAVTPEIVDLKVDGKPVAAVDNFVLVEQPGAYTLYDLRTDKSVSLGFSLPSGGGTLTNCGNGVKLYSDFLVATCQIPGGMDTGIYAWRFELDAGEIEPVPLTTSTTHVFSASTQLAALWDGLYAVDADNDSVFRWSGVDPVGLAVIGPWSDPRIVGNFIVNNGTPVYTIYSGENGLRYSANASEKFTGVQLGNAYLCLSGADQTLAVCALEEDTLVTYPITGALKLSKVQAVQQIDLTGTPIGDNYAAYLVLGVAPNNDPVALYIQQRTTLTDSTYKVVGNVPLVGALRSEFIQGDWFSQAIRNVWIVKAADGGIRFNVPDCGTIGAACTTTRYDFGTLPNKTSILPLDNDPELGTYGEASDPYQCNWGQTEYGALGTPETYMACRVGLPSCKNGSFTVTMCPSEAKLVCDEENETFEFAENWWPSCISWEIKLTDGKGDRACTTHPLSLAGTGVTMVSPTPANPYAFTSQLTAPTVEDDPWFTACEAPAGPN